MTKLTVRRVGRKLWRRGKETEKSRNLSDSDLFYDTCKLFTEGK